MKIWGKIWKDNHLLRDTVVEDCREETRTHKVFDALYKICVEFDLGKPIWLDSNVAEFKRTATAFSRRCTRCGFVCPWRFLKCMTD